MPHLEPIGGVIGDIEPGDFVEDLERYLDEIVEPTIKDLEANRTSVRKTFLACVVVFHAIDYLAYPKRSRTLRQQFNQESRSFAIVDDTAHAFKHVVAGNPASPDLTAREVISRPPAVWGKMTWDLSRWGDPVGGVTLDKERNVDLYDVVVDATAFLRRKLKEVPSDQCPIDRGTP
ncbi:MAG: hypothetical protein Q7T45_14390 [Bradyrhizobium sp.]|uniref:hypothetical protein n=1 Tax=Bradyrhizobium sp. TaxID=376 RepID=UPI0027189A67|nr:hypothetical protein [Bradyrhizobium sp.]MDO8399002.1 hypothetical protein [Bradyrhizobium sp.]